VPSNVHNLEPLLSAAEVARLLRMPIRSVYVLAERGQLGHYRIGRRIRFGEHHVAELLKVDVHNRDAGSDQWSPGRT